MDEMITRMLRASFNHWRANATENGWHMDRPMTFDEMGPDERAFGVAHMKVILAAMREPTYEQITAAGKTAPECDGTFVAIWHAMIDAALKSDAETT